MQSRPDWYGSEWILKGLELNQSEGDHQISVHVARTIIVMGSDQQHALSLNISHTTWNTATEGLSLIIKLDIWTNTVSESR